MRDITPVNLQKKITGGKILAKNHLLQPMILQECGICRQWNYNINYHEKGLFSFRAISVLGWKIRNQISPSLPPISGPQLRGVNWLGLENWEIRNSFFRIKNYFRALGLDRSKCTGFWKKKLKKIHIIWKVLNSFWIIKILVTMSGMKI